SRSAAAKKSVNMAIARRVPAGRAVSYGSCREDFSPRLKPGVSWVRTKQETPNALPTPLAPPFLPIAKARGISEDLDDLWRSPATVFTGRVDGGPDPASLFSRRDAGLVPGADRFPRTGERRHRRDQPTDPRHRLPSHASECGPRLCAPARRDARRLCHRPRPPA